VGDCFQIPLPGERFAYCQYVRWSEKLGYLIRVFDLISDEPLPVESLRSCKELFPPVFVGLKASVASGRWKRIGLLEVGDFAFPTFRCTSSMKPGTYENWWLWEGGEPRFIGKLPPELRSLEIELVWGDELLEQRIATGKNPFAEVA
jgi:hypothetical protein